MDIHVGDVSLVQIVDYVEATFRPLTTEKSLAFNLSVAPGLPSAVHTDEHRLQQVLRKRLRFEGLVFSANRAKTSDERALPG